MSDVDWLPLTYNCSQVGIVFSILNNCTLLALLSRKQARELGTYKYLMATFCVFGMFYSSVEWFLEPLMHIHDDTMFIIQRKRLDYNSVVARIFSSTYCGCFATSFTLFAVHFIYRYLAVCNGKRLSWFEGFRYPLWLFGVFCIAFSWSVFAYYCFPKSDRIAKAFKEVVTLSYNMTINQTDYVPYTYWKYEKNVRILNIWSMVGLFQHVVIMSISYGIVFFCGIQTAIHLKKSDVFSGRTKELQNQLFYALVIQTVLPTLFMYFPASMVLLFPFAGLNIGAWANMTIVSVHLYPGIEPLVIIILIKDFRKTVLLTIIRILKRSRTRAVEPSASYQVPTTS